jgi:hypothetical protein
MTFGRIRCFGQIATLPRPGAADAPHEDHEQSPDKTAVAFEHQGFNLHARVRIEAGDDLGRERLARYALRPPLSLERLRRLPGGRITYRVKYVTRGRGKFRVMSGLEFMARLAAIIAPPRYPLVRYGGVLSPVPNAGEVPRKTRCARHPHCSAAARRSSFARWRDGFPGSANADRGAASAGQERPCVRWGRPVRCRKSSGPVKRNRTLSA